MTKHEPEMPDVEHPFSREQEQLRRARLRIKALPWLLGIGLLVAFVVLAYTLGKHSVKPTPQITPVGEEGGISTTTPTNTYTNKVIVAKTKMSSNVDGSNWIYYALVAADDSVCIVDAKTWSEVEIGTKYQCTESFEEYKVNHSEQKDGIFLNI